MKQSGFIAVAAILMCSACSGHTNVSQSQTLVTASAQPIRWEEVTAAQTVVRPSNSYLIMMR